MGDWGLLAGCGAVGVLVGPALAGVTLTAPGTGRLLGPGWSRGRPAGPRRIVLVSGLSAVVLGVLGSSIGARSALPAFLGLGAVGVALAVIDVEHHRLPDRLTVPAFATGVGLLLAAVSVSGGFGSWVRALAATAVVAGGLTLLALASPGGLGLGDVKLGGLLGLHLGWLGWGYVMVGLVLGFLVGALAAIGLLVARRASLRTPVAFGPALLIGTFLAVALGPVLAL